LGFELLDIQENLQETMVLPSFTHHFGGCFPASHPSILAFFISLNRQRVGRIWFNQQRVAAEATGTTGFKINGDLKQTTR
jgi:hypothetical protein